MPPSVVIALALRILSETGMPVGNRVEIVAPGDFPAIEARIAPLRAFRRRIDGVLDPVIYVLQTTQTFERAAAGHAPSAVLVAASIFHERLHDHADDEASVLTQEAAFLQRYITRTLLRLSTGTDGSWSGISINCERGPDGSFRPPRTSADHPQRRWFSKSHWKGTSWPSAARECGRYTPRLEASA